jgi:O-antigen/teichoic acid export membrane protein
MITTELATKLKGSNLKARSVRGAVALGVGTMTERGLRLVRNMILARVLAPDEFGLMALVMGASVVLEAIAEVGVKQSVIQNKRGGELEYLNTAWWVQVARGSGLFIVAILVAPWLGAFYHNPKLVPLLRVAFTVILFNAFISPRVYVWEKKLQFAKRVFLFQGGGLLGTLLSLGLALTIVSNVWALVIGFVAEGASRCLLSFVLCPFLPRISIHRESLSDILAYARGMFGVPILAAVAFQLDVLTLGKVVSGENVGMYWLVLQLPSQIGSLFSNIVHPVLLPLFAEKQDEKQSLRRMVTKITTWTAMMGIPTIIFLAACASQVLSILYGARYAAVALPFSLLCVYMFLITQGSILSQVYFATGKPEFQRRFVLIRLCLMYPSAVLFGLTGAAAVMLLANLIGLFLQVCWCGRLIGLKTSDYFRCYFHGVVLGLPIIVVVGLTIVLGANSNTRLLILGFSTIPLALLAHVFLIRSGNGKLAAK